MTKVGIHDKVSRGNPVEWRVYLNNNCKLLEEQNGVRHYLDVNAHYVVVGETVFIEYGFAGSTLFRDIVAERALHRSEENVTEEQRV